MTIEELLKALGVEVNDDNKDQVESLISAETAGLKANRDQLKSERNKARDQLKALKGLDVEEVREALGVDELSLDEVPDLIRTAKAGDKDPKLDARVVELEGKLERSEKRAREQAAEAEGREAALKQTLTQKAVESMVTDAVAKAEGNITLLKPHLESRIKAEVDEDGKVTTTVLGANGDPLEDKHGNPARMAQLIDEFANNETFAAAFPADVKGGSDAREGRGSRVSNNPWAKDTLNITKQAEIRRENPQLAERLKSEAAAA